jgi:hypothetical protein
MLWRTLGGAFGIALLLSMAFAIARIAALVGLQLV